jgi:ubiquinone/menaquinone biosynthesis C-methylase UbiE
VQGIDVLVRPSTAIPVQKYDGEQFPCEDKSVDVVMMVDVLHHTPGQRTVLAEAARVARHAVLIKDHTVRGALAAPTLRAMDWVGNRRHGVVLPYNYWTRQQWDAAFRDLSLTVKAWNPTLGLYALPLRPLFERSLHFLAVLEPA